MVPDARLADWASIVVPVPARHTYNPADGGCKSVADFGVAADGVTDDAPEFAAALAATSQGHVCYVPNGTYAFGQRIYDSDLTNVELRGQSVAGAIIKVTGTGMAAFELGQPNLGSAVNITAGATKGSTTVTVGSTSTFTASTATATYMAYITQTDHPYVFSRAGIISGGTDGPDTSARHDVWTVKVLSKTATTITFTPELPCDFENSPRITPNINQASAGVGFRDLTINCNSRSDSSGFRLYHCHGVYQERVEVKNYTTRSLQFTHSSQCTLKKVYFHSGTGAGSGTGSVDLISNCSGLLIEDSIIIEGGASIIVGNGGSGNMGNVFAYNFLYFPIAPDADTFVSSFYLSHSSGGDGYNLGEGNVFDGLNVDGYHGTSNRFTLLRNWPTMTCANNGPNNFHGLKLDRWSPYANVIGNVIGTTQLNTFGGTATFRPTTSVGITVRAGIATGYPNVYGLSFSGTFPTSLSQSADYSGQWDHQPPPGGVTPDSFGNSTPPGTTTTTFQERDGYVDYTGIFHGNTWVPTGSPQWEADDSRGTGVDFNNHTIPETYYSTASALRERIAFDGWSLSFPPINPESIAGTNSFVTTGQGDPPEDQPIPAVRRYFAGTPFDDPAPGSAPGSLTITGTLTATTIVISP